MRPPSPQLFRRLQRDPVERSRTPPLASRRPGRGGAVMSSSPFLTLEEAAAYVRIAPYTLGEKCREGLAPHRKAPGSRRLLFRADELDAWLNGADLEYVSQPRGGRIVRPTARAHAA